MGVFAPTVAELTRLYFLIGKEDVLWKEVKPAKRDFGGIETWGATSQISGKKITIKRMKMTEGDRQQIEGELKTIQDLKHPNLTDVIDFFPAGDSLIVISD